MDSPYPSDILLVAFSTLTFASKQAGYLTFESERPPPGLKIQTRLTALYAHIIGYAIFIKSVAQSFFTSDNFENADICIHKQEDLDLISITLFTSLGKRFGKDGICHLLKFDFEHSYE
jgi:hypothetical protein